MVTKKYNCILRFLLNPARRITGWVGFIARGPNDGEIFSLLLTGLSGKRLRLEMSDWSLLGRRAVRQPRPAREPRVTAFASVAGPVASRRGPLASSLCVVFLGEGPVSGERCLVPAFSGAFHMPAVVCAARIDKSGTQRGAIKGRRRLKRTALGTV